MFLKISGPVRLLQIFLVRSGPVVTNFPVRSGPVVAFFSGFQVRSVFFRFSTRSGPVWLLEILVRSGPVFPFPVSKIREFPARSGYRTSLKTWRN